MTIFFLHTIFWGFFPHRIQRKRKMYKFHIGQNVIVKMKFTLRELWLVLGFGRILLH